MENKNIEQLTILVVEDEEVNYYFLEEVLRRVPNTIYMRACNGEEALKYFNEVKSINLVLMDIKLPDTDGYSLTKTFKNQRPEVPIVAQTAFAMSGDREKAMASGCSAYLAKPIRVGEIFSILEQIRNREII